MNNDALPLRVAIVGSGAAGMFAASAIAKNCPNTDVTIIHDPNTPYLGVGESLAWGQGPLWFGKYLGLYNEFSWLKKSGSTYKYTIALKDWHGESDEKYHMTHSVNPSYHILNKNFCIGGNYEDSFIHDNEYNFYTVLMHLRAKGLVDNYYFQKYTSEFWWYTIHGTCHINQNVNLRSRSGMGYSYHINADHIRHVIHDMVGRPAGVKELPLKVKNVNLTENGNIEYLLLEDDRKFYADLFIDASGFKRILANSLPYEWEPCDEYFNNTALVGSRQMKDYSDYTSETLTQAMKYGWRFSIPVAGRTGEGYQFNDRIFSDEDAILNNYYEKTGNYEVNFRRIKWNPGYYKDAMVKNCIAIGTSQGFSDVFDANNFSATLKHIGRIVDFLQEDPARTFNWRNNYNSMVSGINRDIIFRIQTAFHLARRNDSIYWETMKEAERKFKTRDRLIEAALDPKLRSYTNGKQIFNRTYFNHTFINQASYNGVEIPKERALLDITEFEEQQALIYFKYFVDTYDLRARSSMKMSDFFKHFYPTLDTRDNKPNSNFYMDFLG